MYLDFGYVVCDKLTVRCVSSVGARYRVEYVMGSTDDPTSTDAVREG